MDNTNNWSAVDVHIRRHENGCWTWTGTPVEGTYTASSRRRAGLHFLRGRGFTVCLSANSASGRQSHPSLYRRGFHAGFDRAAPEAFRVADSGYCRTHRQ
jgi:hypothetical protein